MSETHHPHQPDLSDTTPPSTADWFAGWDSFAAESADGSTPDSTATQPAESDWQPVNFPNAISMDAIDQLVPENPIASPSLAGEGTVQPNVDELISLIQELNQCNNALLDRVALLEDALDQVQARSALPSALSSAELVATDAPDMADTVAQLTNELEFVRQANQRQEILIETLKGQLENSQERVAQLERECALVQQRYNEHTQALIQQENLCRDLRARLQRQQRYTMQFKAALEKSLEVPPPAYAIIDQELPNAGVRIPAWYESQTTLNQEVLPKVQQIQPWSSQSQSKFLEKLNLAALTDDSPTLQPLPDDPSGHDEAIASPTSSFPSISFGIKPKENTASQPPLTLEDLNPEQPLPQADDGFESLPEEMIKAGVAEFQAVLTSLWDEPETDAQPSNSDDGLWKDLAQLIDVSADDVVKASAANDFDTFTQLEADTASARIETTPPVESLPVTTTPEPAVASTPAAPATKPAEPKSKPSAPFINNPNWPSPLVHPLRPSKKLASLAAVDLPKFAH